MDALKIDGQFVKNNARNPASLAIFKSIYDIGSGWEKNVVECVFKETVPHFLHRIGAECARLCRVLPPPQEDVPPSIALDSLNKADSLVASLNERYHVGGSL